MRDKRSNTFLIILSFALFLSISLVPAFADKTTLYYDPFDSETSGNNPANWTQTITAAGGEINVNNSISVSPANSMYLTDKESGGGKYTMAISYFPTFDLVNGSALNVSFDLARVSDHNGALTQDTNSLALEENATANLITIAWEGHDNKIYYYNDLGTETATTCTWTIDVFARYDILLYLNNDTLTIFQDGVDCGSGTMRELGGEATKFEKIYFYTSSVGIPKFHVDNVDLNWGEATAPPPSGNWTEVTIVYPANTTYWSRSIPTSVHAIDSGLSNITLNYTFDGTQFYGNYSFLNNTWYNSTSTLGLLGLIGLHNFTVYNNGSYENSTSVFFTVEDYNETNFDKDNDVSEGQEAWYNITYKINFDSINNITGGFMYNSTYMGKIYGSDNNSTNIWAYKNITVPSVASTGINVSFYFNLSLNYVNGTNLLLNSSTENQTIHKVTLDACVLSNTVALNFTYLDELARTNVTSNGTYNLEYGAYDSVFNLTVNNVNYVEVCIYPTYETTNITGIITYESGNYSGRQYWFDNAPVDNETDRIKLSLLETAEATAITFIVYDENLDFVEGAYILVERWYGDTSSYNSVAMAKTNANGEGVIPLEISYAAFYKITVTYGGEEIFSEDKINILASQKVINAEIGTQLNYLDFIEEISYAYTYAGNILRVSIVDATGSSSNGTTKGSQTAFYKTSTLCTSSGSGNAYTLICDASAGSGAVAFSTYITYGGRTYLLFNMERYLGTTSNEYNVDGLLASTLLIVTAALIGVFNPVASILFTILALAGAWIMGILALESISVVGIVFAGILIIYLVVKK